MEISQNWYRAFHKVLPIGQRVRMPSAPFKIFTPQGYKNGEPVPCTEGTIIQHLHQGAVVVRFDNLSHREFDYSAREAMTFTKIDN